ncbi:unnamed protein product [Rotaria magnacalcarata]|uniref:RING-type domain-containing protein n=4 Tax=Rotaria magnacalcarata TaxID=392030 RepID=A0A819SBX8_9BILA|nr:unnamed protein product [Rotaria magnacalcarata]CAF4060487.1 unnamed protein product [Rotaria magnacalcarata]
MDNYEYVNKSNISNDFICEICENPFIDPVALPEPCEQTFCLKCIQLNLENHSQNCLQCNKKSLSNADLKKESLIVRKTLDNLPVKCRSCFQENIRRATFSQHTQEICPKRRVCCSASNIQCPWDGPYDQFHRHVNECPYEKIRPLLSKLINDVARLDHLSQLQKQNQDLENNLQELQDHMEQMKNENESLREKLNETEKFEIENEILYEKISKMEKVGIESESLREKISEMDKIEIENKYLKEKTNKLIDEKQLIHDQYDQYKINNNDVGMELSRLSSSLQHVSSLIEYIEKETQGLQENLNELNYYDVNNRSLLKSFQQQQQTEIDSLQEMNQSLKEKLLHYENELEEINQRSQQIQTDKQQIFTQCLLYETEINNLNASNQRLKENVFDCEAELQQSNQYCQQLQDQTINDKYKIEGLLINIKRLEAKLYLPASQPYQIPEKNKNIETNRLEEFIDKCQSYLMVNLNGEKINDDNIEVVIKAALIKKQCQSLILWNNHLTCYSISRLSSALCMNKSLTKLSISKNHLSDSAIKDLSESLSFNNCTLKQLVLSSNEITDQGLIYLSDMLKTNEHLIMLGLQDNKITDKAIQYLSQIIQFKNQVIEEISLYSNKSITDGSVDDIFNMIRHNQSLTTFWIWDCQLSEQGKDKLQQSIQDKNNFDLQV